MAPAAADGRGHLGLGPCPRLQRTRRVCPGQCPQEHDVSHVCVKSGTISAALGKAKAVRIQSSLLAPCPNPEVNSELPVISRGKPGSELVLPLLTEAQRWVQTLIQVKPHGTRPKLTEPGMQLAGAHSPAGPSFPPPAPQR